MLQADMSRLSLTHYALEASIKHRSSIEATPVSSKLQPQVPRALHHAVTTRAGMPPNPYHTNYVPNLPPSIRDSAVSSSAISSEATHVSRRCAPTMGIAIQIGISN